LKEGEDGSIFFLIISGEAFATKMIMGQPKEVRQYKTGDYFGELALLKNASRAASVFAKT
jgi:cAMP-dependent protein kinase regulator